MFYSNLDAHFSVNASMGVLMFPSSEADDFSILAFKFEDTVFVPSSQVTAEVNPFAVIMVIWIRLIFPGS